MNLTNSEIEKLNDFTGFLSFKPTWHFKAFINCPHSEIDLFMGNQGGKNASVAYGYVLRILGQHPIPKKNVVYFECEKRVLYYQDKTVKESFLKVHKSKDSPTWISTKLPKDNICPECGGKIIQHQRGSRVFRFASETLPGQSANISKDGLSAEVKNTQYPEFKKWLPKFLIKKDITFRNSAIIIRDIFGGNDIIVEFVSYNQTVQSTAGTQRISCWMDESPSIDFLEEQRPRLLAENGDLIITLTPTDRVSYLYDEAFEKASVYYRTESVVNAYKKHLNQTIKRIEKTNSPFDIAVIQAATEDNPTLSSEVIEEKFKDIDEANHPEIILIRRYGIFKQVSGRIFKSFNWDTHFIPRQKYFPNGIPITWTHAQLIDYHEHVPWACGMISLSPTDEAFIWGEFNPSPEKMVTLEIARELAIMGRNYRFALSLVDPLAAKKQTNTGLSVIDDLNRIFHTYKKEGIGFGAYWQSWDSKSTRGRDEIRERLKNALLVGKPFNNVIEKNGKRTYLSTLWILDNCKLSAMSMKNWRLEEWASSASLATKDMKDTPQQKWSHFNTAYESVFKHPAFKPKRFLTDSGKRRHLVHEHYFQGQGVEW